MNQGAVSSKKSEESGQERQSGWGLGKVIGEGKAGEAVGKCRREGGVERLGQPKEERRWVKV